MSTYFLSNCLHKVHPVRLTGGLFEYEGIIYCLYAGEQGVDEVGEMLCKLLGSFLMLEQIGCKTRCFWKNGLGGRHGHRCKEGNEVE